MEVGLFGERSVPGPMLGDSGCPCELPGLGTKVRDAIPLQINGLAGKPGGERERLEVVK